MPFNTYSYNDDGTIKFDDTQTGASFVTVPGPAAITQAQSIDYRNTGEVKPFEAYLPPKPSLGERGATASNDPGFIITPEAASAGINRAYQAPPPAPKPTNDSDRVLSALGMAPPQQPQEQAKQPTQFLRKPQQAQTSAPSQSQPGYEGLIDRAQMLEMSKRPGPATRIAAHEDPAGRSTERQYYDPKVVDTLKQATAAKLDAAGGERTALEAADKEAYWEKERRKAVASVGREERRSAYDELQAERAQREKGLAESKYQDEDSVWAKIADALAVGLGQYAAIMTKTENTAGKISADRKARKVDQFNRAKEAQLKNIERERDIDARKFDADELRANQSLNDELQSIDARKYMADDTTSVDEDGNVSGQMSPLAMARLRSRLADEELAKAELDAKYAGPTTERRAFQWVPERVVGGGGGPDVRKLIALEKERMGLRKDTADVRKTNADAAEKEGGAGGNKVQMRVGDKVVEVDAKDKDTINKLNNANRAYNALNRIGETTKGNTLYTRDHEIAPDAETVQRGIDGVTGQGQSGQEQLKNAPGSYLGIGKDTKKVIEARRRELDDGVLNIPGVKVVR